MAFDFQTRLYLALNDAQISSVIDDTLAQVPPKSFEEALNEIFGILFFLSAQVPDNGVVVTDIQANKMRNLLLKGLTTEPARVNSYWENAPGSSTGTVDDQATEQQGPEYRLYLPSLPGQ